MCSFPSTITLVIALVIYVIPSQCMSDMEMAEKLIPLVRNTSAEEFQTTLIKHQHFLDSNVLFVATLNFGTPQHIKILEKCVAKLRPSRAQDLQQSIDYGVMCAVMGSNTILLSHLLKRGLCHHYKDCNDETPLAIAARNGNIELVTLLLSAGNSCNCCVQEERSLISLGMDTIKSLWSGYDTGNIFKSRHGSLCAQALRTMRKRYMPIELSSSALLSTIIRHFILSADTEYDLRDNHTLCLREIGVNCAEITETLDWLDHGNSKLTELKKREITHVLFVTPSLSESFAKLFARYGVEILHLLPTKSFCNALIYRNTQNLHMLINSLHYAPEQQSVEMQCTVKRFKKALARHDLIWSPYTTTLLQLLRSMQALHSRQYRTYRMCSQHQLIDISFTFEKRNQ